jgi:hypothetical protein
VVVFLWWRAFGVGRGYWLGLALVGLVALGLGGFVSIVLREGGLGGRDNILKFKIIC